MYSYWRFWDAGIHVWLWRRIECRWSEVELIINRDGCGSKLAFLMALVGPMVAGFSSPPAALRSGRIARVDLGLGNREVPLTVLLDLNIRLALNMCLLCFFYFVRFLFEILLCNDISRVQANVWKALSEDPLGVWGVAKICFSSAFGRA